MNEGNAPAQQPFQSASFDRKIVAVVVAVAALAIGAYIINFSHNQMGPPESWGQFGDYLGGIVNPAVGIVTVLLVAQTLAATRQEAADTRAEMKAQTVILQNQFSTLRKQLKADDVRRELEGLYLEWKSHIETHQIRDSVGVHESRQPVDRDGWRLDKFFNDADTMKILDKAFDDGRAKEFEESWNKNFLPAASLLTEIARACHAYDAIVGNFAYSSFYRRRVTKAVEVLSRIGVVGQEAAQTLAIEPTVREPQFIVTPPAQ